MSLPFYKITCSGCKFHDGFNFGVDYTYEGPSERKPLLKPAWCKDCDAIVQACLPFTKENAGDLNQISEWEQFILLETYIKKTRWWNRKKKRQQAEQEFLRIKKRRLAYFESNQYVDRCINCGSHNVFSFSLPSADYGEQIQLGVEHSCGGQLIICMEGRLSFASRSEIVYNETGTILRKR